MKQKIRTTKHEKMWKHWTKMWWKTNSFLGPGLDPGPHVGNPCSRTIHWSKYSVRLFWRLESELNKSSSSSSCSFWQTFLLFFSVCFDLLLKSIKDRSAEVSASVWLLYLYFCVLFLSLWCVPFTAGTRTTFMMNFIVSVSATTIHKYHKNNH